MSSTIYGGDEVGALVFDFGWNTVRCGYAGEELPKADIPSYVGWNSGKALTKVEDFSMTDEENDVYVPLKRVRRKHLCGDEMLYKVCENVQLRPLYDPNNSSNYNFEVVEELLDYLYTNKLHTKSQSHPALFSEPFDNSRVNREKLTELVFERFDCPALSVCKSPVLTAFSYGRTTATVVDLGHSSSSVCPVSDGYCLTQACRSGRVCNMFLMEQAEKMLTQIPDVTLTPMPLIKSRQLRNVGESPVFSVIDNVDKIDPLWVCYHKQKLLQDLLSSSLAVNESSSTLASAMPKPRGGLTEYQLPNGYRLDLLKKLPPNCDFRQILQLYFDEEMQVSFVTK